jgi:quercetin dioxygenase-like cupin family protein
MAPPLTRKNLILHPTTILKGITMKKPHLYFRAYVAALLMLAALPAEAADVKELFAIDLADYPGKEGRIIEVSYPPGARDVVHRHDAHAFVYVLEGQIIMQLKGQPAVTLKAGQTFYEGPTDVHVVGRNASKTKPARFVVVLLKAKGAPVLTPVKE